MKFLRFLFGMLVVPWPWFAVFIVVAAVCGTLAPFWQIEITRGLVDDLAVHVTAAEKGSRPSLSGVLTTYGTWVLLLIGVRLLDWLFFMDTFQRFLATQLQERVRERFDGLFYRKTLYTRLEWLESPDWHDKMQRAGRAMDSQPFINQMSQLLRVVAITLGCVSILLLLGAVSVLIPLILLPGSLLLVKWHLQRGREFNEIYHGQTPLQRQSLYWRNLLTERRSAPEVRVFALGDYLLHAWRETTDRMFKELSKARQRNIGRSIPITAGNVLLFGVGAVSLISAAAKGNITPGTLVAMLFALQQYLDRMQMIAWRIQALQKFFHELEDADEFLSLGHEEPTTGRSAPALLQKGICFEDVSFTYPGADRPTLHNLNLQIRPMERIALVGDNGAGKTTLVKLLLGLYQPTSGRITVDGVDIREIDPAEWRSRFGAVLQQFMQYSLTAQENIGFGALDKLSDRAAIETAAGKSGAGAVISQLPQGYETLLGKHFSSGQDLSRGQWQQLAIARAILRDSECWVFDEPASALDALAERALYQQFLELSEGKIVLFISHRMGSARLSDRILFMESGQITEAGTHQELMQASGAYARLYRMQAEWYQEQAAEGGVGCAK